MSSYAFLKDSLIDIVYDPKTGKEIPAREVVRDDHTGLQLRTALKAAKLNGNPLYLCPHCHTPIYLKSGKEKRGQFFAHWPDCDNSCRWMEKHGYSQEQIRARRFHGQKESHAHKQIKGFVFNCLKTDPMFTDVKVEQVWRSKEKDGAWRKPDVSAMYRGPNGAFPIAFEIQLSSTFLSEIVERREYYRKQGALLVWIFQRFVRHDPKLTQLDIFYPNNLNAFVVNQKTLAKSFETGQFHLECHWAEPILSENLSISSVLNAQLVAFQELTLDQAEQLAYHFDYELHKQAIEEQIKTESARIKKEEVKLAEEAKKRHLRRVADEFIAYCSETKWPREDSDEMTRLKKTCRSLGVSYPDDMYELNTLVQSIASLKQGKVVGFGYFKLIEVAIHMGQNNSSLLLYFTVAAQHYNQKARLEKEDRKGTWYKKRKNAWDRAREAQGVYLIADEEYRDLIFLLFPELEKPFEGIRNRINSDLRACGIGKNIAIRSASEL
jgi:competence CoiA-like predicted nuclease